MRIEQSNADLKSHLIEQLQFIQVSTKEFDNGNVSEAKRIATQIRVLLHDTKNSISLLLSLGDKGRINFLNSSIQYNPQNLVPFFGLVSMRIVNDDCNGFRGEYRPLLNNGHRSDGKENWKPFDTWWNDPIIKDQQKKIFSRKDLILNVANTDGGAHVDKLSENYAALSRSNSLGFETIEKIGEKEQINSIKHIELSSVRQIAFEVIISLKTYYSL